MAKKAPENQITNNKKARFEYEIIETLQAGVVLMGSEIKAVRAGRINLKDSFVRIIRGEAWLLDAHIGVLPTAYRAYAHEERRARKLLLHRAQIDRWLGKVTQDGHTLVALDAHFCRGRMKLTIALARGKNLHDKRQSIRERDLAREAARAMAAYRR